MVKGKPSDLTVPQSAARWLLLVPQLPSKPAYLRVKIWRRLRDMGAVALKNAVYALPRNGQTIEGFRSLLREIERAGGEALLCEADFVAGLRDDQVRNLFNIARNVNYQGLAKNLRGLVCRQIVNREAELTLKLQKVRRQVAQIAETDFFGADGRQAVEALLSRLEHSAIIKAGSNKAGTEGSGAVSLMARVWVTRQGVHVDRIACAWLIRRFIDPKAKFKFVQSKTYRHAHGELRFDMAHAEFTHEGDQCSFETLYERMGLKDQALAAIAEIVHNLDLKDQKFDRPETTGIGHVIEGICATQSEDLNRIARGSAIFDDTYERFRRNISGKVK